MYTSHIPFFMEKLVELAHDKEEWNIIVNTIKTTQALDVIDF